jgi:hypothetical protein
MGKASSNKKVARAASTGGGRTVGVRRPYGWYSVLSAVVAVGIFLVAFSRHQQQAIAAVHPRGQDHWHAAYAIDICGTISPNLPQNPNLRSTPAPGIHTHGDGLIHVEPYVSGLSVDAGNHATLAQFVADYPAFKLTSNLIQYPGGPPHKNGEKCATKVAQVRIRVWAKAADSTSITYSDPKDVHLKNGQAITVAFLPLSDDIPKPPKAAIDHLTNPNAAEPGTTTATSLVLPPVTTPRSPSSTQPPTSTRVPATSTPPATSRSTTPTGAVPTTSASGGAPPTSHP